jgi:hypothetical protein
MNGMTSVMVQGRKRKPQISPLRYAPVEMTNLWWDEILRFHESSVELQIPWLRSPGFPVELGGVDGPHAPFLKRKAHT